MEKEKIKFSYAESGVKTLNALTFVFYFLAALSLLAGIIFMSDASDIFSYGKTSLTLYTLVFVLLLPSLLFFTGAMCKYLSSKAKNVLFKRLIAEQKYEFEEDKAIQTISTEKIENK